jgi:DNA uptake protein ComE-like DNA-binding protein
VILLVLSITFCLSLGVTAATAQVTKTEPAPSQKSAKKTEKKTEKKAEQLDLNSASKQDLMKLPGIDDATAQKIIDNRPYRRKDELVQKNIVSKTSYDKISGQIVARQSTAGEKKGAPAKKKTS